LVGDRICLLLAWIVDVGSTISISVDVLAPDLREGIFPVKATVFY
jgi:hypothetical protein